jgi:hypothetical protein
LSSTFGVDPCDGLFGVGTTGEDDVGVLSAEVTVVALVDDEGVRGDRRGGEVVGGEEVDELGGGRGGGGGGDETDVVGGCSGSGLRRGKKGRRGKEGNRGMVRRGRRGTESGRWEKRMGEREGGRTREKEGRGKNQ